MDFNEIMMNFKRAFQKLLSYRVLASSPSERVADVPLLVVIIAALMAPKACALIAVLALVTGHRFRMEQDYIMRA